ncbi:MAG: PSD1 and planctomycete cytochrome C domain-containing protein [Verrucomicrobiota bacterium]|nr:PSD1 and planctomycete cytochrome C domain-containing protein [Verrucomicrobiota bacterium]
MARCLTIKPLCILGILLASILDLAGVDFASEIQPIFAENCADCHGPDTQKAGLNLMNEQSIRSPLKSGKRALVEGDPDNSELIRRLITEDVDDLMPPPNHGNRLEQAKVTLLRQWIEEGGTWSQHWAYRPLSNPALPKVKDTKWVKNGIDHFILAKLEANGIAPSPRANLTSLIKRLNYDLIGLPPSLEAVETFRKKHSPETYSRLVNRLLSSRHFGERWGRHWLDKARYADSDGYEKDRSRMNAWRYRDWVIDAINTDMPFDRFTIEQLAGDLLPDASDSQRLATAFNRQTLTNTEGGTDQEQWRVAAVMDRTETLGSVWLGLTVGCARCHTHKYDELTLEEYYKLYAYFNNADEANTNVPRSREAVIEFEIAKKAHDSRVNTIKKTLNNRVSALRQQLPMLEQSLSDEIANRKTNPVEFHRMKLLKVRADVSDKVQFTQKDDDSLLVSGENPAKAEYELYYKTGLQQLNGIRLEVLPDDSLGAKGPGRTPHGNFVLNEVRIYAARSSDFNNNNLKLLGLGQAIANYSQKDWPAQNAIDGKAGAGTKGTGWAIGNQYGKPHTLDITLDKPLENKSDIYLHIVLDQEYGTQHTIGRFRITARTGHFPTDGIPADVVRILEKDKNQRTKEENDSIFTFLQSRDSEAARIQSELETLEGNAPKPPVMNVRVVSQRKNNPRTTHILHRGEFKQPREKVAAGTLATLPPIRNRDEGDRLDLARWLVNGQNPLVPRVTVNQIWANLFGEGLVRTLNDFGVRGDPPTHPALLDWLAGEYIRRKWSRKALIRLITQSATYQQASIHRPELVDMDPGNHLIHRQNRFRVEAEIVQDLTLAASGQLSKKIGGASVYPPLPSGVAELSYANNFKWNISQGEDRYRRGMYTFFKRTSPHPNLITFDCPDSNVTCLKRTISNTPIAALATLNNSIFSDAAKAMAKRLISEQDNDTDRIRFGFQLCTARIPSSAELEAFSSLLQKAKRYYGENEDEAKAFNGSLEASAWAALTRIFLNLDEFITRE